MHIIGSVFVLIFILGVMPVCVGILPMKWLEAEKRGLLFAYVSGFFVMLTVFQLISVPVILSQNDFQVVVWLYSIACLMLTALGLLIWFINRKRFHASPSNLWRQYQKREQEKGKTSAPYFEIIMWTVVALLLLYQLYMALWYQYADGDDAYYVATSVLAKSSGRMYLNDAYTGIPTGLDYRHALAPFPIWIAYIAEVAGLHPTVVCYMVLPFVLMPLTYILYGSVGYILLEKKREYLSVYMVFVILLQFFGNYSLYPVETFFITRTRQGKAFLGSAVVPLLFFLFLLLAQSVEQKWKKRKGLWLLLVCSMFAASLASTMGAVLCMIFMGAAAIIMAIVYKKPWLLLQVGLCSIPGIFYVAAYVLAK